MNVEKMKEFLKSKNLTAYRLAKPLDCSEQTIYNTYNGIKHFTMEEAIRIKHFTSMSHEEFKEIFHDEKWFDVYADEAQISFLTKDKHLVDKLVNDSEKNDLAAEFRQIRRKRSVDANAYMWTLCDKIADAIRSTKEDVYREAIRHVGVFKDIAVQDHAADSLIEIWESRGVGWFSEQFDSKIDGCKRVRLYVGSHVYDTKEMSRLIDYIVQEAKELNIETLTPDELARLEGMKDDF